MNNHLKARVQVDLVGEAAWLYDCIAPRKKTEAIKTALLILAKTEEEIIKFISDIDAVNCIVCKKEYKKWLDSLKKISNQ